MDERGYHEPVMVREVVDLLEPGDGLVLDGTVGGGGHALAILERFPECRLLAVDRDPDALEEARRILDRHRQRVRFLRARFDRALEDVEVKARGLSAALLDLGVSSHQLDEEGRGFAFREGVSLDMRMGGAEEGGASAADLLNDADEAELARIFHEYGEERRARVLAREVVRRRERAPLSTSDDLVAALSAALRRAPRAGDKARVFQALRIAVNDELAALESALTGIREALVPGGTVAVLSYHSLEDRRVKHAFREWSRECVCPPELPVCRCRGRALGEVLTRKPLEASPEEVEANPRARSARLRAWRKAS